MGPGLTKREARMRDFVVFSNSGVVQNLREFNTSRFRFGEPLSYQEIKRILDSVVRKGLLARRSVNGFATYYRNESLLKAVVKEETVRGRVAQRSIRQTKRNVPS
jgi:transcriptional regulator CtsR